MKNTIYESPATKMVTVQFRTQLLQTSQAGGTSEITNWIIEVDPDRADD